MQIAMFIDPVNNFLVVKSALLPWTHDVVIDFRVRYFEPFKTPLALFFKVATKSAEHTARAGSGWRLLCNVCSYLQILFHVIG